MDSNLMPRAKGATAGGAGQAFGSPSRGARLPRGWAKYSVFLNVLILPIVGTLAVSGQKRKIREKSGLAASAHVR
jgi:hypothetical protein